MTYDEECPANLVEIKSSENNWIFLFIKIRLGAGLNCSAASEEIKIKYSDLSLQRWGHLCTRDHCREVAKAYKL